MKYIFKKIFAVFTEKIGVMSIIRMMEMNRRLAIADYLQRHLYTNSKYTHSSRLNRFERTVYSQGGDDGIIEEIFKRIGTTTKFFVEFGVGDGLQNNTVALLFSGWKGSWIDGSTEYCKKIRKNLDEYITKKSLTITESFITAENIEILFEQNNIPKEFDFLSIDVDGNDFWIWKSITKYKPRVVVLEYNAAYGPSISFIPQYDKDYVWGRTNFYGSSLTSLCNLAKDKGYTPVACSFLGNNVYFVRNDCVKDLFAQELAEPAFIYEDHKVFLLQNTKYPITIQKSTQ